jgi:hypothetical protein
MPAALYWFAQQSESPDLVGVLQRLTRDDARSRLSAFVPLWMMHRRKEPAALPLSWCGRGRQPVATFRTSWEDPEAMYLAAKGGRANLNHGHMDAGSFVFEAEGVRWAIDLGGVNYNAYEQRGIRLFDHRPDGDRWKIFPYTNAAHNTLAVDGEAFDVHEQAPLTDFVGIENGRGEVAFDLSKVLKGAQQASRRFEFDAAGPQVTVVDHLTGLTLGASIRWTLVTRAEVVVDDGVAMLAQDGKSLRLTMHSTVPGQWRAEPYGVPEGYFGDPLRGVTLLVYQAEAPETGVCELRATLEPSGPRAETP